MLLLMVRTIGILVLALTLLVALDKFGFQIAPLVAAIGVAGVGVGFAFQGVLGNIIAGLSIIFTKPYRVGEYIELLGVHGQVITIELFSTALIQLDESRVVIPNRKIVGEILHNYGTIPQLHLKVGVAYNTNLDEVFSQGNRGGEPVGLDGTGARNRRERACRFVGHTLDSTTGSREQCSNCPSAIIPGAA